MIDNDTDFHLSRFRAYVTIAIANCFSGWLFFNKLYDLASKLLPETLQMKTPRLTLPLTEFITTALDLCMDAASIVESDKAQPIISYHHKGESYFFKLSDLAGTVQEIRNAHTNTQWVLITAQLEFNAIHHYQNKYSLTYT